MPPEIANHHGQKNLAETLAIYSVCLLLFAFVNLITPPVLSDVAPDEWGAALVFGCLGAIAAQGALHAIWCVLAPVAFLTRLALGVASWLILYAAWAWGFAISVVDSSFYHWVDYWEVVATLFLSLPLLMVAVQAPLWIARTWFGWRITHQSRLRVNSGMVPLRIIDIMIATGVVALVLASARLATPAETVSPNEFLIPLAIGALSAAAISLFTTLPAVAATLCTGNPWRGLPLTLLLDILVIVVFLAIVAVLEGSAPPQEVYGFMTCMVIGYFISLTSVMLLTRRLGYRLLWGRRRDTMESPDIENPTLS